MLGIRWLSNGRRFACSIRLAHQLLPGVASVLNNLEDFLPAVAGRSDISRGRVAPVGLIGELLTVYRPSARISGVSLTSGPNDISLDAPW